MCLVPETDNMDLRRRQSPFHPSELATHSHQSLPAMPTSSSLQQKLTLLTTIQPEKHRCTEIHKLKSEQSLNTGKCTGSPTLDMMTGATVNVGLN